MNFKASPEWAMGDTAQKAAKDILIQQGWVVVPVYGLSDWEDEQKEKPPMIWLPQGHRAGPDILALKPQRCIWIEVKAKSKPDWRRCHPGPRWEHGIDFSAAKEYQELQGASGLFVWLVIHEDSRPLDLSREMPLIPCDQFLGIRLDDALRVGERRESWPGGVVQPWRRGRLGLGGWLWPRDAMRPCLRMPCGPARSET